MPAPRSLTTADFRAEPYWWSAAVPDVLPPVALDARYDTAIIGGGLTGLRAAIDLARAGQRVVVLDRADAGSGAARRNAGYVGRTLKKSYRALAQTVGAGYARRVYEELNAALDCTLDFIAAENIDCFANRCGRFIGATSPAHLRETVADYEALRAALGFEYSVIAADDVRDEIGSDLYCGGVVIPDLGSLHPALYHKGLLDRALAAGVTVATRTEVGTFAPLKEGGFDVTTSAGTITARDVALTTNGYTPRQFRWHARRVIPFNGYMAATEPLPPALLQELIPNRRTIIDSNVNIDFFRPAPDSPRLLFGGAAGTRMRDTNELVARLHALLVRIFPQLEATRLQYAWTGQCAGTFDLMPHVGCHEGVWYGLGYNFAGVPMGSYLGTKIAQGILGDARHASVFGETPFKTMPLYNGSPWFVPLAMRLFDRQDRRLARRA